MTLSTRRSLQSLLTAIALLVPNSIAIGGGTFIPPNGYVFDASNHVPDDFIVWQFGGSVQMVPGGRLGSYLRLFGSSRFTMYGGTLQSYVYAGEVSRFTMLSGSALSYVNAAQTSRVDIYGGSVNSIYLEDSGTVNIYGRNFSAPIAPGGTGRITGTLADGTPLDTSVHFLAGTTQARVNLIPVPEPSSILLAIAALAVFAIRRK